MQRYCPNNSNFTFREITCAPPKCDNKKEEPKCDCGNCHFPPWWDFCPPINPPCNDKKKDECPFHSPNNNCNKNACNCGKCPPPPCNNFPCGYRECSINLLIDPRFVLWTCLYPCIFKDN